MATLNASTNARHALIRKNLIFLIPALLLILSGCNVPIAAAPGATQAPGEAPAEGAPAPSGPPTGATMLWVDGSILVRVVPPETEARDSAILPPFWIMRNPILEEQYSLCARLGICPGDSLIPGPEPYPDPYPPPVAYPPPFDLVGRFIRPPGPDIYCDWIGGKLATETHERLAAELLTNWAPLKHRPGVFHCIFDNPVPPPPTCGAPEQGSPPQSSFCPLPEVAEAINYCGGETSYGQVTLPDADSFELPAGCEQSGNVITCAGAEDTSWDVFVCNECPPAECSGEGAIWEGGQCTCKEGYHYDNWRQGCIPDSDTPPPACDPNTCPALLTPLIVQHPPEPGLLDQLREGTAVCPEGTYFDPSSGECVKSPAPTEPACLEGFSFDAAQGCCMPDPALTGCREGEIARGDECVKAEPAAEALCSPETLTEGGTSLSECRSCIRIEVKNAFACGPGRSGQAGGECQPPPDGCGNLKWDPKACKCVR